MMALNTSEADFEQGLLRQRVGGKYVVERILGRGGMGCVALGRHEQLGQRVAIKFMLASVAADETLRARFMREAQLAATLRSDNVVDVFDVGVLDDGLPFMVMEYLEGHSLADELKSRTRLPVAVATSYVLQALHAIAEAHDMGVVHRDLKPDNLFLARGRGGSFTIKVLDFGISTAGISSEANHALTQTAAILGSPQYMSPEQIRESKSVDARADIWSLGVVLYTLVEGTLPFDGASIGEIFGKIQYVEAPAMSHASPELDAVVRRCLARDPEARYASAHELAAALQPFAATVADGEFPAMPATVPAGPHAVAVGRGYSEPPAAAGSSLAATRVSGAEAPRTLSLGALSNAMQSAPAPRSRGLMLAGVIAGVALGALALVGLASVARHNGAKGAPSETRSAREAPAELPKPSATVESPASSAAPPAASASASLVASPVAVASSAPAPGASSVPIKKRPPSAASASPKNAARVDSEPDRGF